MSDMAVGNVLITEAGGLVGNDAGEGDFPHRREIIAANPTLYARMIRPPASDAGQCAVCVF